MTSALEIKFCKPGLQVMSVTAKPQPNLIEIKGVCPSLLRSNSLFTRLCRVVLWFCVCPERVTYSLENFVILSCVWTETASVHSFKGLADCMVKIAVVLQFWGS